MTKKLVLSEVLYSISDPCVGAMNYMETRERLGDRAIDIWRGTPNGPWMMWPVLLAHIGHGEDLARFYENLQAQGTELSHTVHYYFGRAAVGLYGINNELMRDIHMHGKASDNTLSLIRMAVSESFGLDVPASAIRKAVRWGFVRDGLLLCKRDFGVSA